METRWNDFAWGETSLTEVWEKSTFLATTDVRTGYFKDGVWRRPEPAQPYILPYMTSLNGKQGTLSE